MPNPTGKNQYKPNPPLADVAEHILHYWKMRLNDKDILYHLLQKHIDRTKYGLGIVNFRRMRRAMGLNRSRSAGHTVESIRPAMIELRKRFPSAGVRDMMSHLFHETGIPVKRRVLMAYMIIYEPALIDKRKKNRLKRKKFWAAGVNDMWCCDQHDKWQDYGLRLHTGIEPVSGDILWLKVWWTNRNPRLICSYYLETALQLGFIPLVTQSDTGSENYGLAKCHTAFRHYNDLSLIGKLCHRWMRSKKNVKPEITWSGVRRRFTPGFENILAEGLKNNWYDADDPLQALVFRWVFIPWLQSELDSWKEKHNFDAKRADRNKILPQGPPQLIFEDAGHFGVLDFQVTIDREAVQDIGARYAPPDDPVFQLVPPEFAECARNFYQQLGSPEINWKTVWDVYNDLLEMFQTAETLDEELFERVRQDWNPFNAPDDDDPQFQPDGDDLLEGFDLGDGLQYMGGLRGGLGMDDNDEEDEPNEDDVLLAHFTDDEDNEDMEEW